MECERCRHQLRSPSRSPSLERPRTGPMRREAEGKRWRSARRSTIRTVVGVAGVLVQGDDLHALLPVQVVVQLLGRAAVPSGATVAAFAAAATGPAQILALQGSGRSRGRELRALQRAEDRDLRRRQGGQTSQRSRRRSDAGRGGGGRRNGRGRGGGRGEGGRALAEAVSRGLGSFGWLELGEGPTAFELAALREKLLPVLQIGGIHLQERGSARISGLQHRSACGAGRKGTEDVRPPPLPGRAAPTRGRTRGRTHWATRRLCAAAVRDRRRDRAPVASPARGQVRQEKTSSGKAPGRESWWPGRQGAGPRPESPPATPHGAQLTPSPPHELSSLFTPFPLSAEANDSPLTTGRRRRRKVQSHANPRGSLLSGRCCFPLRVHRRRARAGSALPRPKVSR